MRSVRFGVATLVVAAAAFAAGTGGALAGGGAGKVLICGTNAAYDADVQARLDATGRFDRVDVFDCSAGTPTVEQLAGYAGVLVVYSSTALDDPQTLGNELADFADAGGRVVEAVFDYNPGQTLKGRWRANGYGAFHLASSVAVFSGDMPFVEDAPSSALLVGADTFGNGTTRYHLHVSVADGATLIAHWADNESTPLEAAGPHSVALNFFPPRGDDHNDFWNTSTDGTTLIANALDPPALALPSVYIQESHIGVCATKPVYRVADGSWGLFADITIDDWNAGKNNPASPYFGSHPAIYVDGYGLMCSPSDVASYGGDPATFTPAGYDVGGYYPYYIHT